MDSTDLSAGLCAIALATFGLFAYVMGRIDASAYLQLFYLPGAGELTVFCLALCRRVHRLPLVQRASGAGLHG